MQSVFKFILKGSAGLCAGLISFRPIFTVHVFMDLTLGTGSLWDRLELGPLVSLKEIALRQDLDYYVLQILLVGVYLPVTSVGVLALKHNIYYNVNNILYIWNL